MKKTFYVLVHISMVESYGRNCKIAKKVYQEILRIKKTEDFIETPVNFEKVLSIMPASSKSRPIRVCGAFSCKTNPTFCVDQTNDILIRGGYNSQIYIPGTLFALDCEDVHESRLEREEEYRYEKY